MIKRLIILTIAITSSLQLMSQDQPEIRSVFDKYGKQQGVVYVQLSHDILSQGSNLSLYKSMMIKEIEKEVEKEILTSLLTREKSWKKIVEIKKNGSVENGTYYLGKDSTNKLDMYLMIKSKNKKMTILYIEGSFAPERLDQELKKLKDLFIYVNNKKVKLY